MRLFSFLTLSASIAVSTSFVLLPQSVKAGDNCTCPLGRIRNGDWCYKIRVSSSDPVLAPVAVNCNPNKSGSCPLGYFNDGLGFCFKPPSNY